MGKLVQDETHEPRSSSMSLAMRWKHENARIVSVIAVMVLVITLIAVLFQYSASKKTLSVYVDGREEALVTRESLLRDVLDEHAIAVGAHDVISKPLDSEIADGDWVIIERAMPVNIMMGGKKETHYTTKKSVSEALIELNIPAKPEDKVIPEKKTAVSENMHIRIIDVHKNVEERKVTVPFRTVKKADPTLMKGKTKTLQKGQAGLVIQKIEKVYEDGKLVYSKMVDKQVKTKQVNQIVAYGTKTEPEVAVLSAGGGSKSDGSVDFNYKKVLKNVELTAYTEQEGSVGSKTASGVIVSEGRTISVDPDVIPLGWWVYIEGIGFRRAEDTGGAVKGNIIDIYFDSSSTVHKFGRKYGYTVYVIGPVKPELN
ncbi:3D domain-containing protein [Paenibacillus popilliae]|uniref:Uncharacterized protein conserved in bacteria n=1 Tax=Paenibacillus popilliae ATCC 14706 TaxID=1212764 RepID=M9LA42_PAEPP|nr:3D domain-containing protein [Paenibacillus popilliae]GAC42437.1 uncharacterized protein conserved in bacteria [Paenibacillus popilliae ATCC 14706]